MMRVVCVLFPLLAAAQVTKPPEFEQPGAFRPAPASGSLDGTSHVAAQSRRLSSNLLTFLKQLDLSGAEPAERYMFEAGRGLLERNMGAAALEHFRRAAEKNRDSLALRLGYAVTLCVSAKVDEGAAELLKIPGSSTVLVPFLGELASAATDRKPAIENRLRAIAANNPNNAQVRYYLGTSLSQTASGEAEKLWKEAARLDTSDPRPCIELGRVASERGQDDAAIQWLTQALERDPNQAVAHYRLSRIYSRMGKQAESDRHLEMFRGLSKGNAP